jgi:hypothetical protein
MTAKPTTDIEKDREEIMQAHENWWRAHYEMDLDMARRGLVGGGKLHEFGLNGHTHGKDDLDKFKPNYQVTAPVEAREMNLVISGDMAWLTFEGTIQYRALDPAGTGSVIMAADESGTSMRFRATEIYMRDDGEGNAAWRLWHGHYSPSAPEGEKRPGFDE